MMINLNNVDYNPHRDLSSYPIDDTQIAALVDSINQTGFWDNILVRPNPSNPERYQLAYGHHRLAAALLCGINIMDAPCRELSDNDMLHIMIKENATQAGGQSVSATLDSVKATLRYLSYLMLSNDYDLFSKILPNNFVSLKAYTKAKGLLLKGNGLGKTVIHSYDNALPLGSIEVAINTLKADGSFKEILQETQTKIDAEQKEAERRLKEQDKVLKRLDAEQKAKEKAHKAELKRIEAARLKAQKIKDDNQAEAERVKAERLQKQIAEEQLRQAKMQKAETLKREQLTVNATQAQQAKDDTEKAVENAPEQIIDKGLSQYFDNPHQLSVFIKAMQTDNSKQFIPLDQHEPIAKKMIDDAKKAGINQMTGQYITDFVNAINSKALGEQTKIDSKEKLKAEKNTARALMESGVKTLRDANEKQKNALITIASVLERFPEMSSINLLTGAVTVIDNQIALLEEYRNTLIKSNKNL